jgi:hypothetical protein
VQGVSLMKTAALHTVDKEDSSMRQPTFRAFAAIWAAVPIAAAMMSSPAQAVPSYARQTGQDCAACHIGAFGPQLTPFGIKFKLGGYVDSDGKAGKIPLSAMVVADYNRYKAQDADTGEYKSESKSGIAESSIFLAGKLTDHLGSFAQVTNDGIAHSTSLDQVDIRYTGTIEAAGKEALIGVSVNNNPGVQDPFNTLNVWNFPYTSSDHEEMHKLGTELVSGSGEHRVIGVNAYTLLDDSIYAELGLYNTLSPSIQSRTGQGRFPEPDKEPGVEFNSLNNAPYWRVAYMKDLHTSAWHVGLTGFDGTLKDRTTGDMAHKFKDLGVDASYQFLGTREHVVTVNGSFLRERTTTPNADTGEDDLNTTKDYRLAASYHFMNTYGATFGYFKASSADHQTGNRGFIYQADWTPLGKDSEWKSTFANLRLGVQYVAFKGDDAMTLAGDKPGNKNNLRVFAWTAF